MKAADNNARLLKRKKNRNGFGRTKDKKGKIDILREMDKINQNKYLKEMIDFKVDPLLSLEEQIVWSEKDYYALKEVDIEQLEAILAFKKEKLNILKMQLQERDAERAKNDVGMDVEEPESLKKKFQILFSDDKGVFAFRMGIFFLNKNNPYGLHLPHYMLFLVVELCCLYFIGTDNVELSRRYIRDNVLRGEKAKLDKIVKEAV